MSKDIIHEIVSNYREVAADLGRSPSRDEYSLHPLRKFSEHQIKKYFGNWISLLRAAGSTPSRYANVSKVEMPEKISPKILLVDIETAPIVAYTWGIFEQNVGLNQIKQDWSILSFSAKWLGDKEMIYFDVRKEKNFTNDKKLMEELWKLMNEADYVCGHNSRSFDVKKIQARMLLHGMKPPSPFKQLDTKVLIKKHFAMTSNKLEYLADKLCKTKKLTIRKYDGFNLWLGCLRGEKEAWEEMKLYNSIDVLALEELLLKVLPWENAGIFNVYRTSTGFFCNCGSDKFTKSKDFYYTSIGVFEKYSCDSCGSWAHAKGEARNIICDRKKSSLKGPR